MNTSVKLVTAGILALGLGLTNAWADMTKEEAIAKIEAGMSKSQRQNHDRWVTATEALVKAGVAPEKCVELVQSALTRSVSADEVGKLARQIETRAQGDRAAAEKYAAEGFARLESHDHPQAKQMRDEVASPTRGDHAGAGSGYGSGFGSGDMAGGGGFGSGTGSGGR